MKSAVIVALLASLGLLGCQSVVDQGALPAAVSAQSAAIDVCSDRVSRGELTTMRLYMECGLAAQRQFAVSINLNQMQLFEDYRQRVLLLADSYDDGRIATAQEYFGDLDVLGQDHAKAVNDAYLQQEDRNQRTRQIIGAALGGGPRAIIRRDQARDQPSQSGPIFLSDRGNGRVTGTADNGEVISGRLRDRGNGRSSVTTGDGQTLNCRDRGNGRLYCY